MKGTRKINVSQVNNSKQWDGLINDVIKVFPTFEFPRENYKLVEKEPIDKCEFNLIEDDEETAALNSPGNDPFKKSHLRLYIVDLPNGKELDDKIANPILHWTTKCQMISTTFAVIAFQEKNRAIDKSKLVPEEYYYDNILVLQSNEKHSEQYCEKVRQFLLKLIFQDSYDYFQAIQLEIERASSDNIKLQRWQLIKALYLASIGFSSYPLALLNQVYSSLKQKENFDFQELLAKPLYSQRSTYPILNDSPSNVEMLVTALHGILLLSSYLHKYQTAKTVFYENYTFLRSYCKTDEDEIKINEWAETSIVYLVGLFSENLSFRFQLYESLFLIYDATDPEKLFSIKDFILGASEHSMPYSFDGLTTRIATAGLITSNPFTPPKNTYVGWAADSKFLELFTRKLLKDKSPLAMKYAVDAFCNRSVSPNKADLFKELVESGDKFEFTHSGFFNVKLESEIFRGSSDCDRPFNIQVTVNQKDWLPTKYSRIDMTFTHLRSGKTVTFSVNDASIENPLDVLVYFNEAGKWIPKYLQFNIGNTSLLHDFSQTHRDYCILVNKRVSPPININLCTISGVLPQNYVEVYINLKNCAAKTINFSIQSVDSEIQPQTGVAIINSQEYHYKLTADGNVFFYDTENEENFVPLSLSDIKFTILVNMKPNSNICELTLYSAIESNFFETKFSQVVEFPISCSTRLFTKDIVHMRLYNSGPNAVQLKSGQLGSSDVKPVVIKPGKSSYIMSHTSGDDKDMELKVTFWEDGFNFPMVEKSWSVLSTISPNVNITYKPIHPHAGASIKVSFTLPKCSYHVIDSPHFVISGVTQRTNFAGGEVVLNFIPKTPGILKLPLIIVDGVETIMLPSTVTVTEGEILTSCPFVPK